jgi:hypothetical protein
VLKLPCGIRSHRRITRIYSRTNYERSRGVHGHDPFKPGESYEATFSPKVMLHVSQWLTQCEIVGWTLTRCGVESTCLDRIPKRWPTQLPILIRVTCHLLSEATCREVSFVDAANLEGTPWLRFVGGWLLCRTSTDPKLLGLSFAGLKCNSLTDTWHCIIRNCIALNSTKD